MDRKPNLVVAGAGASKLSVMVLDLNDQEEAIALAEKLARETGRNVTVRDEQGQIICTFRGPVKN